MQIIAGKHKGRKLATLPGNDMRPTSGKVREAIFGILSGLVDDAVVLDLFAGTGAFGLEAISRGAAKAVFVESDRRSIEIIRKNIAACGEDDRATVIRADIQSNLNLLPASGVSFDIVFMDPPYNRDAIRPAIENLVKTRTLAKGATLIIEHDKKEEIPADIAGMEIRDRRKYGKTIVTFMEWMA
jgi:16S rRNA (guanine966-N2)-methyltransferase